MDGMKLSDDELTGASPQNKNWRGIIIASLVIIGVISLITVAIIIVSPKASSTFRGHHHHSIDNRVELLSLDNSSSTSYDTDDGDSPEGEPFSFSDMFSSEYHTKSFSVSWSDDDDTYTYRSRQGHLMQFDPVINSTSMLIPNTTFRQFNTDSYKVSGDRKYLLLRIDSKPLYRHSFTATYRIIYRFAKDGKSKMRNFPLASTDFWDKKRIQYAKWSPKGNALSFVYENNLYYQASADSNAVQLTFNGKEGLFYNGICDWLYEEEIFQQTSAHWWSPDSKQIVYAEIDDTPVPLFKYSFYGGPNDIYGTIKKIHYPKAGINGKVIPKIKLIVARVDGSSTTRVTLIAPKKLINLEHYVTLVTWHDANNVIVSWSNRVQNFTIYTLCDASSGICNTNFEQVGTEGKGWVDIAYPFATGESDNYLLILPQRDGNSGHWNHVAKISLNNVGNKDPTFITIGEYEVTSIVGYDKVDKVVYYISTNGDARSRHLFSVKMNSVHDMYTPNCLSCDAGSDCQYVSASMSASSHYYLQRCLGPGVPTYSLKSTVDARNVMMEDNSVLKRRLRNKSVLQPNYYKLKIDGETIFAEVRLPQAVDAKQNKIVYPVMISTYGGPSSQSVTFKFKLGWTAYLTSSRNTIVIKIDGRGSGARGQRFMHKVYRQLGTYEIQDQISAFKLLSEKLPYIDKERVAIFGWSYGGYVAAMVLGDKSNVINCGLSVAPVTDWRLYDSAYTEKYMGLYADNAKGYDSSKLSIRAKNIVGKKIMVVHGTGDDNVHFQNTAQFTRAMTRAGVDYKVQFYTDKQHGLRGRKTRRHLYHALTEYMHTDCWHGGKPRVLGGGDDDDKDDNIVVL